MNVQLIAFSDKGMNLAERLAVALKGEAVRCGKPPFLAQWTEEHFASADALIFVGAAGIAVRAIAPHIKSKTTDPAVLVLEEHGNFVIPILSGHIGGANDLARKVGGLLSAVPVITTATDVNGLFPVDQWARHQGMRVANPGRIVEVSGKLLAGQTIRINSQWPITGEAPEGVVYTADAPWDVFVSPAPPAGDALHLVPRVATLGVGCKKDTPAEKIREAFAAFCERYHISPLCIKKVCSIDLKADEPGLVEFCKGLDLPFETYPADQLEKAKGQFTPSEFVKDVTGVDNVCERSAVIGSSGRLVCKKFAADGVTMALAAETFTPDWKWQDE